MLKTCHAHATQMVNTIVRELSTKLTTMISNRQVVATLKQGVSPNVSQ